MLTKESRAEVAGATQPFFGRGDTRRSFGEAHRRPSTVELTVSDTGEIKVVRIEGKLNTHTWPDAEAGLTQLIDRGATKIVINLEKLEYITSAGLWVLLSAAKRLKHDGGELRICGLNGVVQEVFDISGFTTILSVTKTESEALEGF